MTIEITSGFSALTIVALVVVSIAAIMVIFSKEATRIVIAVPSEHEQEICDYMDDNSIGVPRF